MFAAAHATQKVEDRSYSQRFFRTSGAHSCPRKGSGPLCSSAAGVAIGELRETSRKADLLIGRRFANLPHKLAAVGGQACGS
jgi:hypothetical protein